MGTSDAELVDRARSGDRSAAAAIWDRYGDRVYGLCLSLLRDPEAAADAAQDTFLAAWSRLDQLRDPDRLRPWLFAIARNRVVGRARADARTVMTGEEPDQPVEDRGAVRLQQAELAALVWEAAAGLEERDQLLLELNVRQGLEGRDLADAMGIPAARAYTLTNRVKGRIERSLGALLVARLGRKDCEELAALLAGWDGRFSVDVRRRVTRHVDGCETCDERRSILVAPSALLGMAPVILAPTGLRDLVLTGFEAPAAGAGTTGDGWNDGWPPPDPDPPDGGAAPPGGRGAGHHRWRRALVLLPAAAALLVVWLLAAGSGGGSDVSAELVADTGQAGPPTAVPAPVATAAPATSTPTTTSGAAVSPAVAAAGPPATTGVETDAATPGSTAGSSPAAIPAPDAAPADGPPAAPDPPLAPPDTGPATTSAAPAPPADPGLEEPPPAPDPPAPTDPADPGTRAPATTATTPDPAVPDGGRLRLAPGSLTVRPGGSASAVLTNAGPGPVSWTAGAKGVGVSPASGRLQPGQKTTLAVTVPANAAPGSHVVTVSGGTAPASFTVVVPAPPTPPTNPPSFGIVTTTTSPRIGLRP